MPPPSAANRHLAEEKQPESEKTLKQETVQDLAWFRYQLRKFLRFSEKAARQCGITPQQHQLLLGVAGFTGTGSATVSQLAEFLQERHNSVVGLVERAAHRGLVRREPDTTDRRLVIVSLTPQGEEILTRLTGLHHEEVQRVRAGFLKNSQAQPLPAERKGKRGAT